MAVEPNVLLAHANSCKYCGLIIGQHYELKQELFNIAVLVTHESSVQVKPLINPGSYVNIQSKTKSSDDTEVQTEDGGDILIQSLWGRQHDGIIGVQVTNCAPDKVLKSQEKYEKWKYLEPFPQQRRAFTPFVVSSDGLLGFEANNLLKKLSIVLKEKWQKPYSVVCVFIHSCISIAIVCVLYQSIWHSLIPFQSISQQILWEGGSGTNLYGISRLV